MKKAQKQIDTNIVFFVYGGVTKYRSSYRKYSAKKGALKNFAGKPLCWSL